MIFSRALKYLNYILFSHHSGGHGIHSPFVFDLVSRVFRNKANNKVISEVETVRKIMIYDKRIISFRDLGSGNKLSQNGIRKVSEIARRSPVPPRYGKLLYDIALEFGKPLIIEFGTSLGISTMYMAMACPGTRVITIEGCPAVAAIARENFAESGLTNINVMEGPFEEYLPLFAGSGTSPGLVFIDGNHRKEPVIRYFSQMADLSDDKTVIVIDDINYSREMTEAWSIIKSHEKVSVTVDVFRMGIVFFRKGINHNDYIIRY